MATNNVDDGEKNGPYGGGRVFLFGETDNNKQHVCIVSFIVFG